jgi:hypothetical protein
VPSGRDRPVAGCRLSKVKRPLKIPSTWGAKIGDEQFKERASVDKK